MGRWCWCTFRRGPENAAAAGDPILSGLLAEYNSAQTISPGGDRRIRVRVVVHAGEVQSDGHGNFGEALDVAFRLLDSAEAKEALRRTSAPLALVVSEDIYHSIVRHGYEGSGPTATCRSSGWRSPAAATRAGCTTAAARAAAAHRRAGVPAWRRRLRSLAVSGGGPHPPG